jgi:hypothetical protein
MEQVLSTSDGEVALDFLSGTSRAHRSGWQLKAGQVRVSAIWRLLFVQPHRESPHRS